MEDELDKPVDEDLFVHHVKTLLTVKSGVWKERGTSHSGAVL